MAVTTPYNYFNRQILDTEKHNSNVYSTNSGQGIVSEINGGINTYSADYRIQKEHVWPEEAVRGSKDFALESIDVFSDALAEGDEVAYRAVAGCATRIYVPYDCSLNLWQWSAFIHAFKIRTSDTTEEGQSATTIAPNVFVKAFLNGSALEHTKRTIPTTTTYRDDDKLIATLEVNSQEDRFALQFDMSHLQENVSAGWHDLALRIYIEPVLEPYSDPSSTEAPSFYKALLNDGTGTGDQSYTLHHRVSFGIRNARVLTIL